ncbi:MAG TPA: FAD-dependent oxidoreductase [Solirubrobacteraceae bacterium]|nr:FAD-dependent oxidoreductase [Solirubrobacteraceae bacterium]
MDSAIVVGAGTFGASLAWLLAREGVAVTLIDQFEPGDARSTSGGETRLYRCAHGGDAEYTASARRGRELWRELEAETGERLLHERGVAWFAHLEDGWEAHSERALRELDIPVERLDPSEAARLYPSFAADDLRFVLLEPEAGAIRAAHAVRALTAAAQAQGARVKRARARPAGHAVELEGSGTKLEAGAVIWACGGWLRDLFPGLVDLRVTRQELYFLDGGDAWRDVPAWVDYDLAAYGTGDLDDLGVKIAPDVEGPPLGPDDPLPPASPEGEAGARAYAQRRFPALAEAPLRHSICCRYELSPDSNFIAAPHPVEPGVWIVGGGSGHGFKHGPAFAERIVAALRGTGDLPDRFGLRERQPGRSFRTAGSSFEP